MSYSSRQITDHIIRMAALHTPQQLKSKALVLIMAFLFQHECVAAEIRAAQSESLRDADDPIAVLTDLQDMLAAVVADGATLAVIHDLLASIDADFDKASPPTIKAVVDHMHASLDDSEQRAFLERMLSHPIESSSDEHPQ
jgi:hypothetical protein